MSIEEVVIAARSPWQNPYCERIIGSIRRECLQHVVVFSEAHLKRMLNSYFDYYTGRVVKLRFFKLVGDDRIGEQWPAFVFQG